MTMEIESADLLALPLRKRIAFFGDSITENGTYIRNLEAFFLKHLPEHRLAAAGGGAAAGRGTAAGDRARRRDVGRRGER
ncbi:hypothetical protein [Paenibacillus sp. oral taxon 786]|uniref:hypothetical protein n=1 Tax=Paenibacillus sp. oral taxon 786 TaxID=652715 RepID=UPI00056B405B|nr:hypothetical protein [Paenibacillus sp. oral taxon 786]